jgi:hypothetical protein
MSYVKNSLNNFERFSRKSFTYNVSYYIYIYVIHIIFIYHYVLSLGVCPIPCGHIWYYFDFVRTLDYVIQLVTKHNSKYKRLYIFQYIHINFHYT